MRVHPRVAAAAAAALCALLVPFGHALAAEFRDVSVAAAILYDGPSDRVVKRFIVVTGTPLELVTTLGKWVKVRDLSGDVLWIAGAELGPSRNVIVSRGLASVRRSPGDVAELLFQAERGVLLEVIDDTAPAGWLHVRYRDGTVGYVSLSEVWGR